MVRDNMTMNAIETNNTGVRVDVLADAQLIAECVSAGRPIPPEVVRRVHEEALQITQAIFEKHGLLDIAVPAIRELRGELPQP